MANEKIYMYNDDLAALATSMRTAFDAVWQPRGWRQVQGEELQRLLAGEPDQVATPADAQVATPATDPSAPAPTAAASQAATATTSKTAAQNTPTDSAS